MRTIISLVIASIFVATSSLAIAEVVSSEPANTKTSASPAAPEKSAGEVKPVTQENTVAPAVSGVDQPLCVQK